MRNKNEAQPENNGATATNFESVNEYDLNTNMVPLFIISAILIIYFIVFFYLRRSEARSNLNIKS